MTPAVSVYARMIVLSDAASWQLVTCQIPKHASADPPAGRLSTPAQPESISPTPGKDELAC
jgi:hypothetical protein